MINDWFFSNKGEVIGPFTISDAKLYLTRNPNVYGWHPSFIHWIPVSCIDEFSKVVPPLVKKTTIPKNISDQFTTKQEVLKNSFTTIESSIKNTALSIEDFNQDISEYKLLTQNLSLDVKNGINKIENKYTKLERYLSLIKERVNVANNEMLAVIEDFNRGMNTDDISMPSTNLNAPEKKVENKTHKPDYSVKKAKVVEETIPATNQPIKTEPKEALESKSSLSDYLKLFKKEKSPQKTESQQFYRGVPVEASDKAESVSKKAGPQRMYRGVLVNT